MRKKEVGILGKAWRIVRLLVVCLAVYWVKYDMEQNWQPAAKFVFLLMGIVGFAVFVGIDYLVYGYQKKCPHCGKWHALKRAGKTYSSSQAISIRTEVNRYNNDHVKIGTQDQYIAGTRDFYHKNYKCKCCGEVCYVTYSKDYKNI